MRKLSLLFFLAGCASTGTPPGGPEDLEPPAIVGFSPDSGATNVRNNAIEIRFDEVVNERPAGASDISQLVVVSPHHGAPRVSWHRDRIVIRPHGGLRPNTPYVVTLLPGMADLRNNVLRDELRIVFSTGPEIPRFGIVGRVFDWANERPAPLAVVEAISRPDSIVFVAIADSTGQFDIGPIPAGTYTVRGFLDGNRNRMLDRGEKWDSTRVTITDVRPAVELLAIERDSMPALIQNVLAEDSVTLRVAFNKALDPAMQLAPAMLRVQRADSSPLRVTDILWPSAVEEERRAREEARADSLRQADTTRAVPPPPAAAPAPPSAMPPPPKPQQPPPPTAVVVRLAPETHLEPASAYRVTATGFRNLLGYTQPVERVFTTPRPAPPDTSQAAPPARPDTIPPR